MREVLASLYGWVAQFDPVDTFFVGFLFLALFWIWRSSVASDNTFAAVDLVVDPYTNKASAAASVYMFFAGVSAWYIIRTVTHGGNPETTLLGVLGIFIAKGAGDRAIAAWGNKTPAVASDPNPDPVVVEAAPPAQVETKTTTTVKPRGK